MRTKKRNRGLYIFFICVCMMCSMGVCGSVLAATETEENDTMEAANYISCNTVISGNNETKKDVDYYRFTLTAAGKVSIQFDHSKLTDTHRYWQVILYSESMEKCVELDSAGTDVSVISGEVGLPAGSYYVKINTDYYSAEAYQFRVNYEPSSVWEMEANDGYETANPINVNVTYSGANQYYNDVDYYMLKLPSAGNVSLSFSHQNLTASGRYWVIRLYNADTKDCVSLGSAGTDTALTSWSVGLPAGDYYVRVATDRYEGSSRSSGATYQFRVNYSSSETWEREENGGYGTATPINVNTTYYGANQYNKDLDYYQFRLTSAGKVSIKFDHQNLTNTSRYWVVRLYNESTSECLRLDSAGTQISAVSAEVGLPAGSYYIRVNPDDYEDWCDHHSGATYQLCVNYKQSDAWETEDNDTYAAADPIVTGKTYSGANQYKNDIDYYKFSLSKTEYVRIVFQHEGLVSTNRLWVARVIDSGTKERIKLDSSGTDKSKTSTGVYLAAGDYYVKVNPDDCEDWCNNFNSATYSFSVLTGTEQNKEETGSSSGGTSKTPASNKKTVKKNKTYTSGSGKYTVLSVSGGQATVSYAPKNSKAQTVTIPGTVVINGVKCKVVAIKVKAFKNNTNLKKVTIGSNVKKIGAQAFYGCKRLNKLVIKTKLLTAGKIGSKAFTKAGSANYKKLTVKVPKKQYKTYKTILKKKGLSSKAKISKQ